MKNTIRELLVAQDVAQERQRLLARGIVRLRPERPLPAPPPQETPNAPIAESAEPRRKA